MRGSGSDAHHDRESSEFPDDSESSEPNDDRRSRGRPPGDRPPGEPIWPSPWMRRIGDIPPSAGDASPRQDPPR
jgi:hypothetical protein